MSDPMLWWAYSPADQRWHLLPDTTPGQHVAARCGQQLPSDGESHGTPYGLKCPSCDVVVRVSYRPAEQRGRLWLPYHRVDTGHRHTLLVTHEWDGTRAQEVARLRDMLHQLVGLAEKEDLNEVQLANRVRALAHRARLELEGFLAKQVAELANRWIAAQLPDYRPVDRDRQPDA